LLSIHARQKVLNKNWFRKNL